ncbi:MAG: FG-GAP-like repeat-containing protein [bacterium]|nr:FG-GAP-like repeat-containing protein [bacterium]
MCIILAFILNTTIPEGWPMFRCNQQRTGYTPGVSCLNNVIKKWALLIQNSEGDMIYSGPTAADFDSDGKKDILIGSVGGTSYPTADLYRGYDGTFLWASDFMGEGPYCTPALMDIDGDNKPEVFLYEYTSGRFRCLRGSNGTGLWSNTSVQYGYYCAPLVIEGTSGTVIVGDIMGILYSLNATTGAENWRYNVGNYIQSPSLGDVDGDTNSEIVVVAGESLYVFQQSSSSPIWTMNLGDSATTPMLLNLDTDTALEIVVYCYMTGYVKAFNYKDSSPIIDAFVGRFQGNYLCLQAPSPAGGDVTWDGVPDIFIHNGDSLYCIKAKSGCVLWAASADSIVGSPVVADIDKDGNLEIIVTGFPTDANHRSRLECYEHDGVKKWEWQEPIGAGGYADPTLNEACLADIDGDTLLEIVTVDYSCWLLALDCIPWAIEEKNNESVMQNTKLCANPSIFVQSTVIRCSLPANANSRLEIYDITGKIVKTFTLKADQRPLITEQKWDGTGNDGKQLSSGIYFAKLTDGHSTVTRKLTLLK